MPRPGWYNENALRDYPLVGDPPPVVGLPGGGTGPLPAAAIVDAYFELDVVGLTTPGGLDVYLKRIARASGVLAFVFGCTAPGLSAVELAFDRDEADAEWTTGEASVTIAGSPAGYFRGLLVTGPLGPLLAVVGDGEELTGGTDLKLEPACLRLLAGTYVRSVTVANRERLTATTPGEVAPPFDPGTIVSGTIAGLPGAPAKVGVSEGYGVQIRQDATEGTLAFSAGLGLGEGLPCGEVKLTPSEAPPAGSLYLTGGPACSECISSINGRVGRSIRLLGRGGVLVETTGPHEITVGFGLDSADHCPPGP